MKKISGLIPAYVISFVVSFMIMFFEPITMYAGNIDDFWFDMYIMIKPILIFFLVMFVTLLLIYSVVYFICCKILKKINLYNVFVVVSFVVFICTYIHGNFFSNGLPSLDGTTINWNSYLFEHFLSVFIYIIVSLITLLLVKKYTISKFVKNSTYFTVGIFFMLSVSLVSTLLTTDVLEKKQILVSSTVKNINVASSSENFFIFLLDAVDSRTFSKVMDSSEEYNDLFDDFTYYSDAMSVYPFTRDSVPFIISGMWNRNETDFSEYSTNAFNNSKLLNTLKEKKYDLNYYDYEITWNDEKALNISNLVSDRKINYISFVKQELKFSLFKYLPYPLKKYSKIDTMDFNACKIVNNYEYFDWSDLYAYNTITNNKLELTNKKIFQFIHIEGGHTPFDLDSDLSKIENGTYEKKLEASMKIVDAYLNRLKENNVYDNSVIIILSDHGYSYDDINGRFNPILYIKGINESHDMNVSDIPISYEDLSDVYMDLLDGKSSYELLNNIDISRERKLIWYEYLKEDHMIEYVQKGKAWDINSLIPTGKEFNR